MLHPVVVRYRRNSLQHCQLYVASCCFAFRSGVGVRLNIICNVNYVLLCSVKFCVFVVGVIPRVAPLYFVPLFYQDLLHFI